METLICSDFDEFVHALPDLSGQFILRTPQTRDWRLRLIDLGGVKLTLGSEGAGKIYNGASSRECFHVYTLMGCCPSVAVDGSCLAPRTLRWIRPDSAFHISTKSPIRWLNVTIDVPLMLDHASIHQDNYSSDLSNDAPLGWHGQSSVGLIQLAQRLFHVAIGHPERLKEPGAARTACSQVVELVANATLKAADRRPRESVNRRRVLDRALDLLEAAGDETLSTLHLCKTVGCSERTLRNAFHDYFEMSPHQYLAVRRLHAIRAAIREAKPSETITSICSRYGVWDYGRLASAYRSHFGIFPSQAIRQQRYGRPLGAGRSAKNGGRIFIPLQ